MNVEVDVINQGAKGYDNICESDFFPKFAKALKQLDSSLAKVGFTEEYRMRIVSKMAKEFNLG